MFSTPATTSSTRKRKAATPAERQPSGKKLHSTLGFDNGMSLIRRTVSGVSIPIEQGIMIPMEDDEFVGAPEEQDELTDGGADGAESTGGDDEAAGQEKHVDGSSFDLRQDGEEEVDEDLFASTFGMKSSKTPGPADDDDYDSDDSRGVGTRLTAKAKGKQPATDYDFVKSEHTDACNGTRGGSTPPASPNIKPEASSKSPSFADDAANTRRSTATPAPPLQPKEPNLEKDISRPLNFHKKFHAKAIQLIPRLELADHRYWIGVLNMDKKPLNAKEEKHFTWMKGNRVTTVSTIWHTYQTTTMTDGFVLLLGGVERVDFKDRCEELDYFNDKKIIFRAVDEKEEVAKGRELSEGLVPEMIEILD